MGDKNMQISGVFSKIKLPNLMGGAVIFVLSVFVCNMAGASQYLPPGCSRAVTHTACVDPISMGPDNPNCKRSEDFISCTACYSCYELRQGGNYPNNEMGDWSGILRRCYEIPFTDVEGRATYYYEMRTCGGTTEYRCKSSYNGYPLYQSRDTVTCRTTGSTTTCSGCSACRTDSGQWKDTVLSGYPEYQQYYQYVYSSAGTGSCTLTPQQQFRCAAGYYGTPNSTGTSGCHPCPTLESSGITIVENPTNYQVIYSLAGSTDVTDCYARNLGIDGLVIMNDGTGDFYWTWDDATANEGICHYGD